MSASNSAWAEHAASAGSPPPVFFNAFPPESPEAALLAEQLHRIPFGPDTVIVECKKAAGWLSFLVLMASGLFWMAILGFAGVKSCLDGDEGIGVFLIALALLLSGLFFFLIWTAKASRTYVIHETDQVSIHGGWRWKAKGISVRRGAIRRIVLYREVRRNKNRTWYVWGLRLETAQEGESGMKPTQIPFTPTGSNARDAMLWLGKWMSLWSGAPLWNDAEDQLLLSPDPEKAAAAGYAPPPDRNGEAAPKPWSPEPPSARIRVVGPADPEHAVISRYFAGDNRFDPESRLVAIRSREGFGCVIPCALGVLGGIAMAVFGDGAQAVVGVIASILAALFLFGAFNSGMRTLYIAMGREWILAQSKSLARGSIGACQRLECPEPTRKTRIFDQGEKIRKWHDVTLEPPDLPPVTLLSGEEEAVADWVEGLIRLWSGK